MARRYVWCCRTFAYRPRSQVHERDLSNSPSEDMLREVLRVAPVIALALASACASAANHCEGRRPWKSADAVRYSDAELRDFYALASRTQDAYKKGNLSEAKSLARQYLALAPRFPCDWNYGNAVHDANAVLGLIALQEGNRSAAVAHLLAAGQSRGSPQLDSFGPSLLLAARLAEAGEYEAVASYVRAIRRFWEAEDGSLLGLLGWRDKAPMSTWLEQLASRQVPDFGRNALKTP